MTPLAAASLPIQYPSQTLRPSLSSSPVLFFLVVQLFAQRCYATLASFREGESTLHYFWAERNPVSDVMGLIPKPWGDVLRCCNGGGSRQRSRTHQNAAEHTHTPFILMSAPSFFPFSSILSPSHPSVFLSHWMTRGVLHPATDSSRPTRHVAA